MRSTPRPASTSMSRAATPGISGNFWSTPPGRARLRRMCGIVGVFLKNPGREAALGGLLAGMLAEMSDRGPDSAGSHALGHTRMATESAVTTEHSHPFSTGIDLCLVHNGSLSNHNRLRRRLQRHGIGFTTDNDSEVAAGYFTYQMQQGATLQE